MKGLTVKLNKLDSPFLRWFYRECATQKISVNDALLLLAFKVKYKVLSDETRSLQLEQIRKEK